MLIKSKIYRPGGTHVELGKGKDARKYHFKPDIEKPSKEEMADPDLEHVAEVEDKDDVATFLAIPEGYEVHSSELKKPAAKAAVKVADEAVAKAQAEEKAKAAAAAGPVAAQVAAKDYKGMKKPDLIKLVAERTGKAPHGTTPASKLIEQLEKLDAAGSQ